MISEQDAALQRAQDYVRNRGWRVEPLTWEEVEVLVAMTYGPDLDDFKVGYDEGYADELAAGRAAKAKVKTS